MCGINVRDQCVRSMWEINVGDQCERSSRIMESWNLGGIWEASGRHLEYGIFEACGRHLGGIWQAVASGRHLGGMWEASGRHLGDIWETSWRHLGGILEASERHLGGIWEASGRLGWPLEAGGEARMAIGGWGALWRGKCLKASCFLQHLSSRPPVSLEFWRGDPHICR